MWSSLRVRLLGLVLLAVIPALGLLLHTSNWHRRHLMEGIRGELLRWTRLATVDHAQLLDETRQLLATLAKLPELHTQDPTSCQALLDTLMKDHPYSVMLGVADEHGTVFCSASATEGSLATERSGLQRVFETREFVMGEYVMDPVSGTATMTASYPMLNTAGQVQAVVFTEIDMARWFDELASGTELPKATVLMAVDRHGRIFARYPESARWTGRSLPEMPLIKTILVRGAGVEQLRDVDGTEKLFAFTLLEYPAAPKAYISVGIAPAVIFARPNQMFRQGLLWLGLASVLALTGAWVGSDALVLKRVGALVKATERLASGDLAARTGLRYGGGEIDHLARTFDGMAGTLQQREQQLRAAAEALRTAHEELEIRVQERTADLRMANKRLEEVSQLKDEFVSIVSHELRTPLVSVKGALDLVLDSTLGPINDEQHEYLDIAQGNANRISELITTILDVSKIESGRMSLVRQRMSVPQLIEASLKSYKGLSGSRTFTAELAPVPAVFADPNRILQVVSNLITNAVKFTPEQGTITVAVAPQDGMVAVSVQDTGVGIAEGDLTKLFQKFSQVGEKEARRKGTGLGLVLCKQLVELHRGTITVTSELGKGTRFTFTLPPYTTPFVLQESLQELLEAAKRTQQEAVVVIALAGQPLAQRAPDAPAVAPGDRLEHLAQSLRRQLLEDEVVLSLEPQWLAVLSIADPKDAHVVLRRLRIALDRVITPAAGAAPVPMGMAVYPTDGREIEALFAQATRSVAKA
ncbi:MAG: ATP-binding protein [Candidatus Omnitrophota bacterium]|nr:ATP-binding protein [Candidatus Omnitrophota bacterium]